MLYLTAALRLVGGVRAAIFLALLLLMSVKVLVLDHQLANARSQVKTLFAERDAAINAANLAAEKLKVAQAAASERVVTKYVDRVKVVEGRTRTIIKEIPVYVPADSADLPRGFRVLHDAAAQGVIPDPARIADASPVPAQDAAATVTDNYGTCHANAEQVTALQDWIRAQQAIK